VSDRGDLVELVAPDITAYRSSNTGIEFVTTFESGVAGPHVMVNAVTHGNEICGAITLDFLLRNDVRPVRGAMTLGFGNHRAYRNFDPSHPTLSRFVDEDFNRLWSPDVLDGPRNSAELERAREMRPLIDRVDYLLDLHSMQTSVAPLMLAGPLAKGRELAAAIGYPEHVVCDHGHTAGKRLRDYAQFGDPDDTRNALLIECGQHWERSSAVVSLETTLRFLSQWNIIDPDFAAAHLADLPAEQKIIEVTDVVTIGSGGFRFVEEFKGLEVISKQGTVLGIDGDEEITTPYDNCVLIMPSRRLNPGHTAVRLGRFI